MSNDKAPLRETHHLAGKETPCVILLRWEIPWDGLVYSVDFEIVERCAQVEHEGQLVPRYPLGEDLVDGFTEDPAKARPVVRGFLKWDGCMQFTVDDQHRDSFASLEDFGAALLEARRLAAEALSKADTWMPGPGS